MITPVQSLGHSPWSMRLWGALVWGAWVWTLLHTCCVQAPGLTFNSPELQSILGASGFWTRRLNIVARCATKKAKMSQAAFTGRKTFAGSGYANWISDNIMLGRYPYVEPSRLRSEDAGQARLAELLRAGIDVFVSLVGELPPQEHSSWSRGSIDGFGGYANPVKAMVSGKDSRFELPKREVKFLYFPITDLSTPSYQQLGEIVLALAAEVQAGRKLYVHCWGGRGRAGLVGASLLGHLEELDAETALDRIQTAYSARKQDGHRSPETWEQVDLVRTFLSTRS